MHEYKQAEEFSKIIMKDIESKMHAQPDEEKSVSFRTMLSGVLVLLLINSLLFTGSMIPAMWELTSVFWLLYCVRKGV